MNIWNQSQREEVVFHDRGTETAHNNPVSKVSVKPRPLTAALAVLAGSIASWNLADRPPTRLGFLIEIPIRIEHPVICADSRITLVHLRANSIEVDGRPIPSKALETLLASLYRSRVERVLFLKADSDLEVQEVASLIDRAHRAVPGLQIAIVTPAVEKEPCLEIPVRPRPLPLPE